MSRRRFFTPQSTYNAFISSSEHHKQPSTLPRSQLANNSSNNNADLNMPASYQQSAAIPMLDTTIPIQPPTTDLSTTPLYLNRRNLDEVVRRKSLLIFINALFGITLMIIEQHLCWNGHKCVDNRNTIVIKFVLLFFSLLLVYQILDRKRIQIAIKFREKRRKNRNRHQTTTQPTTHLLNLTQPYNVPLNTSASHVEAIMADTPQYQIITLLSLRPSQFRWKLWTQCIIAFIHPFPYASVYLGIPDEIGLLMFLRLQLIFRVIRDYSEIWLNRRSIKKLSAFQSRTPDFNWWLSFKTVCFRSPIQFALSFSVCAVLIYGFCIYILEREAQPTEMWYWRGVWLAFQAVTILWTSDVYSEFNPITWPGRLMCSLAAVNGLLLSSFIIGTVSQQVRPSPFEESALNWVVVDKIRSRERDVAARLIQFVWRNYLHEQELQYKLKAKNARLYEEIADREEKEFMEEFLARSKLLRNIRRDRAELEDQLDPTHGGGGGRHPMNDQYIDDRLEAVRSDMVQLVSAQDETLHRIESMLSNLIQANAKQNKHRSSASRSVNDSSSDDESGSDDDTQPSNSKNDQQARSTEARLQRMQQQQQQQQHADDANEFEDWLSIQERQQQQPGRQRAPFSTPLRPQTSPNRLIDTTALPGAAAESTRTVTPSSRGAQRRTSVMSRTTSRTQQRESGEVRERRRKNIWDLADSDLSDSDEDRNDSSLLLSSTATLPSGNDSRIRALLQRVRSSRPRSDSVDASQQPRQSASLQPTSVSPSNRMPLSRMFSGGNGDAGSSTHAAGGMSRVDESEHREGKQDQQG